MKVPYDTWWGTMQSHHFDGVPGQFVHPACDRNVIAGKYVSLVFEPNFTL